MTLVSSQSAFFLHPHTNPHNNSGGILLNARSLSAPLHPHPHHREPRQPSSFASSSSSASQASDSRSRSSSSAAGDAFSRKIRFAPLPDPRREDFPSVFYQDDSDSDSLSHTQQLPRHASAPVDYSPQAPPSPAVSAHDLSDPELHTDNATLPGKRKGKKWSKKILGPLLQPLRPSNGSNKGGDDSAGLFRTSSKDSTKANGDSADEGFRGGAPLDRRMSTGCRNISSAKEAERSQTFRDGAPLTPTMSENGSKGRKDGQRMLNGRVYGRRPSSVDRQRAEKKRSQAAAEPEFVEWGYGGMGSVNNDHARGRSGSAGPDWAKVQSKGKVLGEDGDGSGEGDDGSGMGWVRKRREQREREQREKEEREKAQSQQVPGIEVHPPEKEEEKAQEPSRREENEAAPRDPKPKEEEEHPVYRAVSVPAPHHHHARHHSHSHKGGEASGTATPTSAQSLSRGSSVGSVPLIRSASLGSQGDSLPIPVETKEEAETSSGSSVKSSASATSSESLEDDEDDNDDTERESEDEEEDDEDSRITSKCAGVEKISRHKE